MQPPKSIRTLDALMLVPIAASLLTSPIAHAEEGNALYDNLTKFRPREGNGVFSATDLKAVLAQPFTAGEHGTICSVKFPVERFGNPTGIVPVEIWDDENGRPGDKVATVGEFDISTIALRQDGGEMLHFETTITGLTPEKTYYLLTDDRETDVTGLNKTYGVPTTIDNEDTNRAGKMLGSADGGVTWQIVGDVQVDRNYRIMQILECPPDSEEDVLYDNLPDPLPRFIQGGGDDVVNAGPPGHPELQPLHAQPFLTNEWGTVDAVTIYIVGTPQVEGTIDLVVTEDGGGFPGETVSAVGTIDLGTLSVWDQSPIFGDLLTFEANLTGLEPNTLYYVGFDTTKMAPVNERFPDATFFNLFRIEDDGTNGAGVNMVGPFGEWRPLSDFVPGSNYMLMRITAFRPTTNLTIAITEDGSGSVTIDPALERYPIGSEVTVTAIPGEGFEFAGWIYGDDEFMENPATITIQEGSTLTPIFEGIEEPPLLNVDIAKAVVVSWDSENDSIYQIYRSLDMEKWELAVDGIEGTGERLMNCFVRQETEVFYRVEEKR